mmetsp:Transcript_6743/g.13319  ORF Transcript_6743/g.13319 Transcript_6743/m.13319 type:complete len:1008 (-) Transcript_6743:267-3290(-)|eukprot:CAMPEP_0168189734 /NCGR_PEP_ID=MMETSP0139_2-20121125/16523_1 /TAXON_ID=44445 /ORGANISM="Pseudo-nitzschia australis, Strain 10249 10 AB" /LENGTH=1007 /DNA_ID=CAMNT_0008112627 /DNA_START=189 /DNA_END=3212 /DNA_ORIENTATION=+
MQQPSSSSNDKGNRKGDGHSNGKPADATKASASPSLLQLAPRKELRPGGGYKNANDGGSNSKNAGGDTSTVGTSKNAANKNKNNRRRRNNNNYNQKSPSPAAHDGNVKGYSNDNGNKGKGRQRQRQRQRGNRKGGDNSNEKGDGNDKNKDNTEANEKDDKLRPSQVNANAKTRNKKRNPKKTHPWRRHIPEGTVDPITLEDLNTLEYPPFALVADKPYVPVPRWPVPTHKEKINDQNETESENEHNSIVPSHQKYDVEDLNRQRLADQWGEFMLPSKEKSATASSVHDKKQRASSLPPPPPLSERPLNLFDGRALAFYMVSQLQFIDPFTRRDLTRPELQNLDSYLDRYGSGDTGFDNNDNDNNNNRRNRNKQKQQKIRVTDAYDAKGITLSSAGAAAATAQGRADIMQQMAQQFLNSLFVGQPSVSSISLPTAAELSGRTSTTELSRRQQAEAFSLQEHYAELQRQERAAAVRGEQQRYDRGFGSNNNHHHHGGDFGGGGFTIIDDDEHPELRGRGHHDFPSLAATSTPSLANGQRPAAGSGSRGALFYSASHVLGHHGGGSNLGVEPGAFPSLPTPASANSNSSTNRSASSVSAANVARSNGDIHGGTRAKKSKTLSKISGTVKKTTAEEKQRQWEAREAARRKAMMSNLTFGMNHAVAADPTLVKSQPAALASAGSSATEEQLQRNRAFAEALGVKPATQRHYASGWARPTTTVGGADIGDEHLDELDAALYPDELILQARDHRMQLLLKIEKRWKAFLNDDKAASLPLSRMDRPSRKFVHRYGEFWKLKTESFDPEPNRYIHCVKLLETRMPQPLLSDTVRNWRGPSSSLPIPDATRTLASVMNDHTSQQTAGQTSGSSLRELKPPSLKVRSATSLSSSKGDLVAFGEAVVQNSRSDALRDKDRPKMNLIPRSVPLELPPFEEQLKEQQEPTLNLEEDLRKRQVLLEEKRQREREIEQRRTRVLEQAFASDDEDERNNMGDSSDNDSEWEDDQEALYDGGDEE